VQSLHLIQTILIYALPVLLAITLHEAAHAYVARMCGDNTAYMLGRVTLNPAKHIDPIGTVLMPLLLYFATSGAFVFGYAKPVPVNFRQLRNPKRDMVWVALAGPMANFVQAFVWSVLLLCMQWAGMKEVFFIGMAHAGIGINLVLWAFNLFPLPPLDGGRIVVGLLPFKQAQWVARIEPFGFFILIGLMIAGIVGPLWLYPLINFGKTIIQLLLSPLSVLV